MNTNIIYTLVWVDEEEKWYYFKENFDKTQFKDGYADYYVIVNNGIIIDDTYSSIKVGKKFSECYNIDNWENRSLIYKLIKILELDVMNIKEHGDDTIEGVLNHYKNMSEDQIIRAYEEYYG